MRTVIKNESDRTKRVKKYLEDNSSTWIKRSELVKEFHNLEVDNGLRTKEEKSADRDIRRIITRINNDYLKKENTDSFHISINKKDKTYKYELSEIGIVRNAIKNSEYITFDYVSKRKAKRNYSHIAPISIDESKKYFYAYRIVINGKEHELSPDIVKRFYFDRVKKETQIKLTNLRFHDKISKAITNTSIVKDDFGYLSKKVNGFKPYKVYIKCTNFFKIYIENEYNDLYKKIKDRMEEPTIDKQIYSTIFFINYVEIQRLTKLLFGNFKNLEIVDKHENIDEKTKKSIIEYINKELTQL